MLNVITGKRLGTFAHLKEPLALVRAVVVVVLFELL
jgi:hypothetical protein